VIPIRVSNVNFFISKDRGLGCCGHYASAGFCRAT
jgi:hypothetical protein